MEETILNETKGVIREIKPINILNESKHDNPSYSKPGDAGMDLRANVDNDIIIKSFERKLIHTDISIELPDGYEAQIRPRSGLAYKHGISILNTPGTIDSEYRGKIGIILINMSKEDFIVKDGDRIAQMVINKYETVRFINVDKLGETNRGTGGFGHTGV